MIIMVDTIVVTTTAATTTTTSPTPTPTPTTTTNHNKPVPTGKELIIFKSGAAIHTYDLGSSTSLHGWYALIWLLGSLELRV